MEKVSKKVLSKCVSQELDNIGFDRKRIRERIHANSRSSKAKDISTKQILKTDEIEKIFVGSQREGIGLPYFNDIDILQINHGITCIKDRRNIQTDDKLVFQMIQKKAPAGYTFLKLLSKDTDCTKFEEIKYAMVKTKQGKFLSSKIFMTKNDNFFQPNKICYRAPRGPSIPMYLKDDTMKEYLSLMNLKEEDTDFVRAFPCQAEWFLRAWNKRHRRHGWPSRKAIAHVMTLPTYVVPVGQKHSVNDDLQWRISFTVAETYLIQSFNNIQIKVLILMKLIAKYILQPACADITSYVVKTVTLWMAENIPQKKFRQKHLIARLKDALEYLETSVERKYLPSYMIPKRNLFTNKLQKLQQKLVLLKLKFLIQNGLKMVSDFPYNSDTYNAEISSVRDTIYRANVLDKIMTCRVALLTTQQLADYCYTMSFISAKWQVSVYNKLFMETKYFYKYGRRGFSDPLSFDLSDVFAKQEKEEQAALNKILSTENELSFSQPAQLSWEWNLSTLATRPFNMLFPLFYLLFFVMYLLLKSGRIFLT